MATQITLLCDFTFTIHNGAIYDFDDQDITHVFGEHNVTWRDTGCRAGGGWPELELKGTLEDITNLLKVEFDFDDETLEDIYECNNIK